MGGEMNDLTGHDRWSKMPTNSIFSPEGLNVKQAVIRDEEEAGIETGGWGRVCGDVWLRRCAVILACRQGEGRE